MVVQYVLTQFLDFKTMARFKACSRFAKECVEEYERIWKNRFKNYEERYGINISKCTAEIKDKEQKEPEDKFHVLHENEDLLYKTNQMYRLKDFPNTFRMFCGNHQVATLAELRGGWAWTNDYRYYIKAYRPDSIFTPEMPELSHVCWYDPYLKIHDVIPGKYSMFVRHLITSPYGICGRLNVDVKVEAVSILEDESEIETTEDLHKEPKFPKLLKEKSQDFFNEKLCDLDLTPYSSASRINITVKWFHNDLNGIGGYIIDGVLLLPSDLMLSEDTMPTISSFLAS
ncbi:unnamed protein product [Moneuplotes crassus]|uniref:Uncharacterized protein n=1 Tax=Euplotes crassus TaxID=5936 RepID=A0AAD1USX8_EUPCR|nr:unnamed protein product [Moneuplotes crassus]